MNKVIYPREKNIYVSGSVEHKFNDLINFIESCNKFNEDCLFIINGGICYGDEEEIEKKIDTIKKINKIYYNANSTDLLYLKKLKDNLKFNKIYNWIMSQKISTKINFVNQTSIIILAGGVNGTKKINYDSIENCFINNIDGVSWHDLYKGDNGFIISNNPANKDLSPKLYQYSCSIGLEDKNKLILQEINSQGLKNFIII